MKLKDIEMMDVSELEGNPIWENLERSDLAGGKTLLEIRRFVKEGMVEPISMWACVRDSEFMIPVITSMPQAQIDALRKGPNGCENIFDMDLDLIPMTGTNEDGLKLLMIYSNKRAIPKDRKGYRKTISLDFEACYRNLDRWNLDGMAWDSEQDNVLIDRETAEEILTIPTRMVHKLKKTVPPQDGHD